MCPHVKEPSLFCIQVPYVFELDIGLKAHLFTHIIFPENFNSKEKIATKCEVYREYRIVFIFRGLICCGSILSPTLNDSSYL